MSQFTLRGLDERAEQHIRKRALETGQSLNQVVLGELFFGFRRGTRRAENMKELDIFLQARAVRVEEITSA